MKFLGFLVRWFGFLVGLISALVIGLALAGPLGFPFELIMSWPYLVGLIGIIGAILTGFSGWPRFATAIFAGALGVIIVALAAPGDITRAKAPALVAGTDRLIWGNALGFEANVQELMQRTAASGPQTILAVGEVPRRWDWDPTDERKRLNMSRAGGLAVEGCASTTTPLRNSGQYGGRMRSRTYALKVSCPNYTLFAVHLTNPLWERGLRFARRGSEFDALARAIAAQDGPVVVIGDFNAAPNAPPLIQFTKAANLQKTACGGRWVPTWRPLLWRTKFNQSNPLTGIPIDHLFTRDISVRSCTVGLDFGSDHLPLVVELEQRAPVPLP